MEMVIIRLARAGKDVRVALLESPYDAPSSGSDTKWACEPKMLREFIKENPSTDIVRSAGTQLMRSLTKHPAVRVAMTAALAETDGCPIYLRIESDKAAEYPWEALFDPDRGRFVALDTRFPFGRIVAASKRTPTVYVGSPLRMLVVLSAAGVDAAGEWHSIAAAVDGLSDFHVSVLPVVGQHSLFKEIEEDTPEWCEPPVLLTDAATVGREMRGFAPHFVHCFCHGSSHLTPFMELATPRGHMANESDLKLEASALRSGSATTLLFTLNCCSGASDSDGVRGLTSQLVSSAGYLAAIGMREPITDVEANLFSCELYASIFESLAGVFASGMETEVEWAVALCTARQALDTVPNAARNRKWTVPILCVSPSVPRLWPVLIHPSRTDPKTNEKDLSFLNTLAAEAAKLTLSPTARAAARERIRSSLAELESPLSPAASTGRTPPASTAPPPDTARVRRSGASPSRRVDPDVKNWPSSLQINALAGEFTPNTSELLDSATQWAARPKGERLGVALAPDLPADQADWRDPNVGWGLVLPDDSGGRPKKLAAAKDAPDALQRLLAERPGAPVLRYRAEDDTRFTHLRRYYKDGSSQDIRISGSERGIGRGQLPRYLMIYGTPEEIPWRFQYLLNQSAAVGRLALEDDALERYVDRLIGEWDGAQSDQRSAVVWAVDHGPGDISHLMRVAIAEPIYARYAADTDLRGASLLLAGETEPTSQGLIDALAERTPATIVTTSHGMTGPLGDVDALRAGLGLPIDVALAPLELTALLSRWQPDGAIWYSHACCSAGVDSRTAFAELFPADSSVGEILTGVTRCGARVAPLPQALLSAEKPARAFIGHVEPTFDWTLRDPQTSQPLTASIKQAFFDRLFQPWPVGHVMREYFQQVGELFGARDLAYDAFNNGHDTMAVAFASQLAALDRRSMVIVGDPTVTLPPLKK